MYTDEQKKANKANPYYGLRRSFYSRLAYISPSAVSTYVCLMGHVNWKRAQRDHAMVVFPSRPVTGRETGLDIKTVTKSIQELEKLGYITKIYRSPSHSNNYVLSFGYVSDAEFFDKTGIQEIVYLDEC